MTEIKPQYFYEANVIKVVDGDTVDLSVALGFHVTTTIRFRLARINAAEMSDPRPDIKTFAVNAKSRLTELLIPPIVTLQSHKHYTEDKYGRWVADLFLLDGRCVNDILLAEGLVKTYPEKY